MCGQTKKYYNVRYVPRKKIILDGEQTKIQRNTSYFFGIYIYTTSIVYLVLQEESIDTVFYITKWPV